MVIGDWFRSMAGWFSRSKSAESTAGPARIEAVATTLGSTAGYGGYLFDGAKFRGGLPSTGNSPIIDHRYARINAREQYHVTPVARAMVERFAETVVDDGLRLEPTPSADVLGLTQEQASEWSRRVAERFHLWASSKFAVRAEDMTFYQAQRLAEIFQQRDGEYFVRFHYESGDRRRPFPLAISFVDPGQIVGLAYTSTQAFQYSGDGIDRDEAGKEIGYNVQIQQDGKWDTRKIPAEYGPGRRAMIHGFSPEYAGQGRGYSRLAHAIQEFEEITQFTTAQIQKAIKQSAIVMSKETEANSAPTGSPFGDAASNFATNEATDAITPAANEVGYSPLEVRLSPGGIGIFNNGAGEHLKPFESTAPADGFESFTNAFISHLAAASSIPIEVLLLKFNSNYSASRAALVMFWRVAVLWRKELASDFLDHVYEAWLSEEIAAGRITARGWLDPVMRLAWLSCEWVGSNMPNIDPVQNVKGAMMAIESNLSNFEREARELNGSDSALNKARNAVILEGMSGAPWNETQKRKE